VSEPHSFIETNKRLRADWIAVILPLSALPAMDDRRATEARRNRK
jgi:hypothetical protein